MSTDHTAADAQMTLEERLTAIQGVGDATAGKILDALQAHESARSTGPVDDDGEPVLREAGDGQWREAIADAHDYHQAGDHEYAEKFVRRAYEAVVEAADGEQAGE